MAVRKIYQESINPNKIIRFSSPEEMADMLLSGVDLYSPKRGYYLGQYGDTSVLWCYGIDEEQARELERQARKYNDYWTAFISSYDTNGTIVGDPEDDDMPSEDYDGYYDVVDLCDDLYKEDWLRTSDVLD